MAADAIRLAAERLQRDDAAGALQACRDGLAAAPDAPALLRIAGIALGRLDRPAEALPLLMRAIEIEPANAAGLVALGVTLVRVGRVPEARSAFGHALAIDPRNASAWYNAGKAALDLGEARDALSCWRAYAELQPQDYAARQRLVDALAGLVRSEPARAARSPEPAQGLGRLAIGMCSIDAGRERRAVASLRAALPGHAPEFVVLHDARSLAEAYNRILEQVRADVVLLCHDDIEVLVPSLVAPLQRAFQQADIVGVAGAERVTGPAVLWAGHPHIHGWVSYPRDGHLEAAPLSLRSGVLPGMQALDGVFLAMRGDAAARLRFDAATFDGFHFYDLDFTYRAHRAGLRLAVSTDILLLHASAGDFGDSWKRYAAAFLEKFPEARSAAAAAHWYGARLETREQLVRFHDELAALDREARP